MQRYDDPQSSSSLFVGLLGLLVVILIVLFVQVLALRMEKDELVRKNIPGLGEETALLRVAQEAKLQGYAPIEGVEGAVTVPIDRAMEWVVDQYGR